MVQHVVRSRRWKYVRKIPGSKEDLVWKTCPDSDPNDRDAVVEELYDLQADAMETCNIAEFDSKVKSKLSAMMDEWLARETQRRSQMSATSKVKLDEKTKRELEALGYAGG